MTNITSFKNTLKTLPLIGLLAIGLALVPATAMAGNGDRDHKQYSKKSGQHYDKGRYRSDKHASRSRGKGHMGKHVKYRSSAGHPKHYYKGHQKHNRHYARHDHHYDHRGHDRYYVVNDYYPRDRFIGLDHLGFMIGLHTNNLDITFRD